MLRRVFSLTGYYLLFFLLAIAAYYKIFTFWFFHGWEASWLFGLTGGNFTLVSLMQSHGFISYINYVLFGWNPQGWFATALLLHVTVAALLFYFLKTVTKEKIFSLFAVVLFVATTANHDVITWGSFESLYAAQTLGFYFAFLCFYLYRTKKSVFYYGLSLFFFFISAVLRESGLIFIPLIILFDQVILRYTLLSKLFGGKLHQFFPLFFASLKQYLPFFIIAAVYIYLRTSYGGSPHDFIDERVQYRILLFHERRIIEYLWLGILAFGQYIPPYFIPYPWLNSLKQYVFAHFSSSLVQYYFFVVFGWGCYSMMILFLYIQRKQKYFRFLLFFFLMFSVITMFYSYAWTTKLIFLTIPYSWSENRWRYLAYTAFAPFFIFSVHFFLQQLRRTLKISFSSVKLLAIFVGFHYILQLLHLHAIQQEMYTQNSYPAIRFFKTLHNAVPSIRPQSRIVYNRASPGLNDFLAELAHVYKYYYPELPKIPIDWIRADMYYPLLAMSSHSNQADYIFLDYSPQKGLINKTEDVKRLLASSSSYTFFSKNMEVKDNTFSVLQKISFPVEQRYKVNFVYSAMLTNNVSIREPAKFFMKNLLDFIGNTKVSVCKTQGPEREPFTDFDPMFAVDGNIGPRSIWWADCRPAWITLDLGAKKDILGVVFTSTTAYQALPRDYQYQVSDDGKTWKSILRIKENAAPSRIDFFENKIRTRFIRFFVQETQERHMLIMNEIMPIFYEQIKTYKNPNDAYAQVYKYASYNDNGFAAVHWETDSSKNASPLDKTYYLPIIADGMYREASFVIPDSEYYSGPNQFLERFLTGITITFPENTVASLEQITISPYFQYE